MGKRGLNRKGLSEVVTTVLIILLVLAAIIIIWMFARAAIQSGSGQVEAGLFTSVLEIKGQSVGVDTSLNTTSFVIQRKAGKGEVVAYNIVLTDVNGDTCVQRINKGISELETQRVDASYNTVGCEVQDLAEISVAPIVLNLDGQELTGEITGTYKIKGLEGLPEEEPEEETNYLIAYWAFDETSGPTAEDSSVNENDGAINGATWVSCQSGTRGALNFDGVNDNVLINDNNEFDFAKDNFTISLWMYPTDLSGYNGIISGSRYVGSACQGGWAVFTLDNGVIQLSNYCDEVGSD